MLWVLCGTPTLQAACAVPAGAFPVSYQTVIIDDLPIFYREAGAPTAPTLVLWGTHDPSFTVAGATAYTEDVKEAEVHLLDAGHFALDEAATQVAELIGSFWARRCPAAPSAPLPSDDGPTCVDSGMVLPCGYRPSSRDWNWSKLCLRLGQHGPTERRM
jgi:hypothetical protein